MTFDNELDDRLRSAQRRQLQAVEAHVQSVGLGRPPVAPTNFGSSPGRRWLMLSATAATALVVAVFAVSQLSSNPDSVSTVDSVANDGPVSTTAAPTTPTTEMATSTTPESTTIKEPTATTAGTATTSTVTSNTTTEATVTSTVSPSTTAEPSTSVDTASTATTALAKASNVCPSGFRAPLESATVEYLSEETGWDRKDDLIDEQDAQYYFNTWEPNYPGLVQVEMVLPVPVLATDLRVAQDPINEVSGVIDAETAGLSIRFVLEGLGGWRVHDFDEPTLVERVTFTRSEASANIVEVMVCVGRP